MMLYTWKLIKQRGFVFFALLQYSILFRLQCSSYIPKGQGITWVPELEVASFKKYRVFQKEMNFKQMWCYLVIAYWYIWKDSEFRSLLWIWIWDVLRQDQFLIQSSLKVGQYHGWFPILQSHLQNKLQATERFINL